MIWEDGDRTVVNQVNINGTFGPQMMLETQSLSGTSFCFAVNATLGGPVRGKNLAGGSLRQLRRLLRGHRLVDRTAPRPVTRGKARRLDRDPPESAASGDSGSCPPGYTTGPGRASYRLTEDGRLGPSLD